ncbi:uncharacterized protein F5891DRAFT_976559 [Suillus fuscotomentosus]|uniref:Uncharacterized protein n=1 Tax=Suillus fuscotomentosus TaxID=1912939 RepID=A0AAD4EHC1_9AGAM|nr:uncharacterized protein F5891DRAFT_976559 [Suillus fuscotomentosus]KAG1904983.1 hypothetical protein F5891DRAFT_976559 [Suillus fuscotomentosus]
MDVKFVEDATDAHDCSDDDSDVGENMPRVSLQPETIAIPMPSNFGKKRCEELGIEALVRQEITLHEGQANDVLHTIRKYWPLERTELKANLAVADLNIRGQRNSMLPWFWSLDVQGDSVNNNWLNEWCIGFIQKLCETAGLKS